MDHKITITVNRQQQTLLALAVAHEIAAHELNAVLALKPTMDALTELQHIIERS